MSFYLPYLHLQGPCTSSSQLAGGIHGPHILKQPYRSHFRIQSVYRPQRVGELKEFNTAGVTYRCKKHISADLDRKMQLSADTNYWPIYQCICTKYTIYPKASVIFVPTLIPKCRQHKQLNDNIAVMFSQYVVWFLPLTSMVALT